MAALTFAASATTAWFTSTGQPTTGIGMYRPQSVVALLRRFFRRVAVRVGSGWRSQVGGMPGKRRFLDDQAQAPNEFLGAAKTYVSKMEPDEVAWLYRKPIDPSPRNPAFYSELYPALNLIKAMNVSPGGCVLEVGCGPGWITELLMLLGFEVDAVEPSREMILIAKERIASACRHHRVLRPPRVEFHELPLENSDFPEGAFDGILFYDSFHHIIDEHQALRSCFRFLREGGVLGISEGAWHPGDSALEEKLRAEMARFGTLENPFTREYLDYLLKEHGFVDVTRYHSINGFFPVSEQRISTAAQQLARDTNNLSARKPSSLGLTTLDFDGETRAEMDLLSSELRGPSPPTAHLQVRITNHGKTTWLHQGRRKGWVTIALRSSMPGLPDFSEAAQRIRLTEPVRPGCSLTLSLKFDLPQDFREKRWCLDLVNEGYFWFSARGTHPTEILLPPAQH